MDRVSHAVGVCTDCLPDVNMLVGPQLLQFCEDQVRASEKCRRSSCIRVSAVFVVPMKPVIGAVRACRPRSTAQSSQGHYSEQVMTTGTICIVLAALAPHCAGNDERGSLPSRLVVLGGRVHLGSSDCALCAIPSWNHGTLRLRRCMLLTCVAYH